MKNLRLYFENLEFLEQKFAISETANIRISKSFRGIMKSMRVKLETIIDGKIITPKNYSDLDTNVKKS